MRAVRILQDHAGELPRAPAADHPLVERCAAASIVLIGAATHGTHDFHDLRAHLTRRLVEDHGFHAVAIGGLAGLPSWVWQHRVMRSFVDWLDERNASVTSDVEPAVLVGLDGDAKHMAVTLEALRDRLAEHVDTPRLVVWAHNTHAGDGRATEMGRRGGHTLGQLVRDRHPGEVVSIAMTTHTGVVTAAHDWRGGHHCLRVLEALPGSYEELFHAVGRDRFWLSLADEPVRETLSHPRLERAIEVVYTTEDERVSHYFAANLAHQFDLVCHIDRTTTSGRPEWAAARMVRIGRSVSYW